MNEPGYVVLGLDELDKFPDEHGAQVLLPLQRRLGFRPFGVNCWEARAIGQDVIEPHREVDGDEELYVVVRGRARFTLGTASVDAPAGTLVHVPAGTFRAAVAEEPDTLILAAGARVGEAWSPAPWVDFQIAFALARQGHLEGARRQIEATIAAQPDAWQGPYNGACFEAIYGDSERAFAHLRHAVELAPDDVPGFAHADSDFAKLQADPRWNELMGPAPAGPETAPDDEEEHREGGEEEGEAPVPGGVGAHVAHIDDLERIELPDGFVWRPIRRRFGIQAFGVNAYSAREAGGQIVEEHTEQQLEHEEIYLVLRGRVRFTVDGNERELGPMRLVFVSETGLRRGAVAIDEDAVVLALGGKPGEPHTVSAWETMFAAVPLMREGRWDEAIRMHEEALAERPDEPALLYNLACCEAQAGRSAVALAHLQRAVELDPKQAAEAAKDADFDPIRDDPGFPSP